MAGVNASARVVAGFAYGGSTLYPMDEETVAFVSGNSITFLTVETRKQRFVWGDGQGISAFASCPLAKSFAYCASNKFAEIVVCEFPSCAVVTRLRPASVKDISSEAKKEGKEGVSEVVALECTSLAFSREGGRLASCGNLPTFEVIVWDLQTSTKLASCKIGQQCSLCAFHPSNENLFYATGENGLWILTVHKEFEKTIMNSLKASLSEDEDESMPGDEVAPAENITAALWGTDHLIYVANAAGELLKVDPSSGQVVLSTLPFLASDTHGSPTGSPLENGMSPGPMAIDRSPGLSPGTATSNGTGLGMGQTATVMSMVLMKVHLLVVTSDAKVHALTKDDMVVRYTLPLPKVPAISGFGIASEVSGLGNLRCSERVGGGGTEDRNHVDGWSDDRGRSRQSLLSIFASLSFLLLCSALSLSLSLLL